jgi:MraZ protein
MFRGNSPAKVDEKGRLKIPASFLSELKDSGPEFYVTSIQGDRAHIYPMKAWNDIEDRLAKLPTQHPIKQKFLTRTSYYGQVVALDGQGRLLIPQVLREVAQIRGDVDVMGSQSFLEVWNHEKLSESMRVAPLSSDELNELGI